MDTGNDFLRPSKIGIRKESFTFSISQSNQQLSYMASAVLNLEPFLADRFERFTTPGFLSVAGKQGE